MSLDQDPPLVFTEDEIDMLARTVDAMTAYMGKPVLAEVIDAEETGFEWVLFAIPLETDDDASDLVTVQIGGEGARIIGQKGGLPLADGDIYECQYLWAIQLSDLEGVRFIKLDDEGDEVAWSDDLSTMLPFALDSEPSPPNDSNDSDTDEGEDPLGGEAPDGPPPTLH